MLPVRVARRAAQSGIVHRALSTSGSKSSQEFALTPAQRDESYPQLGNREIVGFGLNGTPVYIDMEEVPAPAIRWAENTAEVMALREKEKEDWKGLSLEDKKALYRASFRQTYAEMNAPTGEWRALLAGTLFGLAVSGFFMIFLKTQVYPPKPITITEEWMHANLERMIKQGQGPVEGVASLWDYEKNCWK